MAVPPAPASLGWRGVEVGKGREPRCSSVVPLATITTIRGVAGSPPSAEALLSKL